MGGKKKKKKVLLSGSDPFYLSKKLRRRRYGEVSAQTSQKSQNRALKKKKKLRTVRLRRKHVPHHVDHQQNIFKIGNPSGEPGLKGKKKKQNNTPRGNTDLKSKTNAVVPSFSEHLATPWYGCLKNFSSPPLPSPPFLFIPFFPRALGPTEGASLRS